MNSRSLFFSLFVLCVIPFLFSCNIYRPFNAVGSDQDHIEEALKCLHDGNFDCAIENYQALTNAEEKDRRLCTVYMSKAGMTLDALINVFEPSAKVTGVIANSIAAAGWTQAVTDAAVSAKASCDSYAAATTNTEYGLLLKALSRFVNCATLIAKTDVLVGSDADDTVCTTAGRRTGTIRPVDIVNSNGHEMCKADVVICQQDALDIAGLGTSLSDANMKNIADAITNLPEDLKNLVAVPLARIAIQSML